MPYFINKCHITKAPCYTNHIYFNLSDRNIKNITFLSLYTCKIIDDKIDVLTSYLL